MGEHQIYIKVPFKFDQLMNYYDTKSHVKSNVIALTHYWLYGEFALEKLIQFLNFYKKGIKEDEYFVFGVKGHEAFDPEYAAQSLYSIDFKRCIFEDVNIEPNIIAIDPKKINNDQGATVIDLSGEKPKYCFIFPKDDVIETLSAEEYFEQYYSKDEDSRFKYWNNIKELEELRDNCLKIVNKLDKYEVISNFQLQNIFPKLEGVKESVI